MPVSLETQRKAQDDLLQAALAWWESNRPTGWDLRQHLDCPKVNAVGTPAEQALAQAVAAAVEVGVV